MKGSLDGVRRSCARFAVASAPAVTALRVAVLAVFTLRAVAFGVVALGLCARGDANQTTSAQAPSEIDALFARMARGDEAAERALVERGESAAVSAFANFSTRATGERRARARIVELGGGESCISLALAALADPDETVRATCVRFLARPELAQAELTERIARLAARLKLDPNETVRAAAAQALVEIGTEASVAALDATVDSLAGAERGQVAALVAGSARGRDLARARLVRAAAGQESAAVFAALLVPLARSIAETEHGFENESERAPFLAGLRHPDPLVRRAAQSALDALVGRLVGLLESKRADLVLESFERDGLDRCRSLEERARIALLDGRRDDDALARARALIVAAREKDGVDACAWRARAAELETVALIARGELEPAAEASARAAEWAERALAKRLDLSGKSQAIEHARLLLERASIAVTEAARRLALAIPLEARDGTASGMASANAIDPLVLTELRRAHRLALEAQVCAVRNDFNAPTSFDAVIASSIGVHELVLDVPRHPAWSAQRSMSLRIALGRALASVAPLEMIGFTGDPGAPPEIADPHRDPERRTLLVNVRTAECDQLSEELSKELRKQLRTAIGDPLGVDPEERLVVASLQWRLEKALEAQRDVQNGDTSSLVELRSPSSYVAWTARALRDEGRSGDARPFLIAARSALDASAVAQRFYWGLEMRAEVEIMLGGSWSDDNDPKKAELELSNAVERLKGLEAALRENGASLAIQTAIANQRCSALVALAVNANVKMHDQQRALAWFEEAWTLRKDDFMRVLLACYRARYGRTLAARALLREVTPGPATYYNMACTHALLGEHDLALAFLKRELEENHPTSGALARQKEWARTDPDLESLRDDPRFRALVGDSK